jgi:hypothetical protein
MELFGIATFERFFREAAGLDVDKGDLRRFDDFVDVRIHSLLLRGVATARANARDVVEPQDLPITKGLQECIHNFKAIAEEVPLDAVLEQLNRHPPLELAYSDETRDRLPQLAGGLGVALARTFHILDEDVQNPQTRHWEQADRVFDLLL